MLNFIKQIVLILIIAGILLPVISGCHLESDLVFDIDFIVSYRDIPGITDKEIEEIEKLKLSRESFSYGTLFSTEAFLLSNGEHAGFTEMFCSLLSELFGIRFVMEIYEWDILKSGIDNKTIDFTGELTPTAERHQYYFMSYAIAQRSLTVFTYEDSLTVTSENDLNGLKIGFWNESITAASILNAYPYLDFEVVNIRNYEDADLKLKSGDIDALIMESVERIAFFDSPNITTMEVTPLVYTPVSLATANPELEAIISVVNKYIAVGGINKLNKLYKDGYSDFKKHMVLNSFTEEELEYLNGLNGAVPVGYEFDTYPVCFYDETEEIFQGIAVDILAEITMLTGIEFVVANNKDTPWAEILEMLRTGEVALVSELFKTEERKEHFLWAEKPYFSSPYAFLSKADYPNLDMYQIEQVPVGAVRGTSYEELYNTWFPDSNNLILFDATDEVLNALEKDEIFLALASGYTLLYQMNYREKPGYKINFAFLIYTGSYFGFNKNEEILCSIVDKVMLYIDNDSISKDWTSCVYDYSRAIAYQRSLYFAVSACVLLVMLVLLIILYMQNDQKRKTITGMAKNLQSAFEAANTASRTKSNFITVMSREIHAPMKSIIELAQTQLQKRNLSNEYEKTLEKIYICGNSLLGVINDIHDLSKIETGKLELNLYMYDLPSLINDVAKLTRLRIGSGPIKFILDVNENLPLRFYGDEQRLKQLLNNLLLNAVRHTEQGHIKLLVNHFVRDDGQTILRFVIEDTGQGIKPEEEQLLSENASFNAESDHIVGGTGIGLRIAKNLSEMMGGAIEVKSQHGKGTVFTVMIKQESLEYDIIGSEFAEKLCNFSFE